MKKYIVFLFLFAVIVPEANAETIASWEKISITSNELKEKLDVIIETDDDIISKLVVVIGNGRIELPSKFLRNTKGPQIETTTIGYWNPEKLDFYIGIHCGLHSSFPHRPQPAIHFFIFKGAKFSHKETYSVSMHNENSLDYYRLKSRDKGREDYRDVEK